jgi:hypothetical protein
MKSAPVGAPPPLIGATNRKSEYGKGSKNRERAKREREVLSRVGKGA